MGGVEGEKERLTVVPGLEDARVREAVVLADEAADVVGAGDDVRVAGGGKGVLVLVVHVQADLLAGDPCEEEEGKLETREAILSGRVSYNCSESRGRR